MRYRMAVVTHSTADLVNVAGGWLFDRVMAGWDVTVLAPDLSDPRPLRILGARVVDLRDAMAIRRARVVPQSYALSATVCATEERVHDWALSCLGRGGHEVTLWGEDLPDELGSRTTAAQHAPSRAARAFKARAMAAIADPARPIAEVETFRIAGRPRRGRGEPLPV
ncbi:hypothetical protein [Nocardia aurantia]|uniref:hypothetical protein n=1 Tax=Nocardia aurantia TaxID=2585199 RepID=UPI0018861740